VLVNDIRGGELRKGGTIEWNTPIFGVSEENWRDATCPRRGGPPPVPGFAISETPRYIGRGIATIAADPDRSRWN
jgi:hypothetical protein